MGICKINENGHWAVDGEPIYTPTTVAITNSSILSSDSKRAESGKQYLRWIRNIRNIKITYGQITGHEVAFLHNLLFGKEYDFTFYDNEAITVRAFAKKDSYSQHRLNVYPDDGGLYKNYTIEIEVV